MLWSTFFLRVHLAQTGRRGWDGPGALDILDILPAASMHHRLLSVFLNLHFLMRQIWPSTSEQLGVTYKETYRKFSFLQGLKTKQLPFQCPFLFIFAILFLLFFFFRHFLFIYISSHVDKHIVVNWNQSNIMNWLQEGAPTYKQFSKGRKECQAALLHSKKKRTSEHLFWCFRLSQIK